MKWPICAIFLIIFISGCVEQNPTQTIESLLSKAVSDNTILAGKVIEIPADTVIDNIELARKAGISYTELGFFVEEETGLIHVDEKQGEEYTGRQTITAPQTVKVFVEADCNNWGKTYEGLKLYDCMVRFKPY